MLFNTISKYGLIAKIFHWVTFLFLLIQIPFGFYLADLEFSVERVDLENLHNIGGMIILYFIILRVFWKLFNQTPEINNSSKRQIILAKLNHFLLYLIIIVIALSGILKKYFIEEPVNLLFMTIQSNQTNFKISDFFSEVHEVGTAIFIILFILHVFAVIYHHLILKDKILNKII
jgi:cytochrome b561